MTVKYAADGADAGTTPDRFQSLHDNLLGNFDPASIADKFFDSSGGGSNGGSNGTADNALGQQMLDLTSAYASRGVFSGMESDIGGARHDAVRAFDYDQGWARPDYVDRTTDGVVDARAQADNGLEMRYGDGNTTDGWSIVRHEGAGVELALKVKHRGGSDYDAMQVDADGTVHYHVQEGTSAPNRAEWNFDFAATKLAAGDDEAFTFKLLVDRDATAGTDHG